MKKYEIPIPLPSQGLNCIDDSLIADNEAAEGTKNISFKDGVPTTRKGYVKYSPFQFEEEDGVGTIYPATFAGVENVLAVTGGVLTVENTLTDEFDEITGTFASDIVDHLNYGCSLAGGIAYGDKTFILDGTTYQYWDGVNDVESVPAYAPSDPEISAYGTNVLTTTPDEINKQKFIILDDERVWLAGYGKLVRMSHLQKPDYFPSTHAWQLKEDCTGIAHYMGDVMLFTENTATLISGKTPDWTLPNAYIYTNLPGGYGCDQHRSIAIGNNALYWANRDGVFRYRYLPSGYSIPECVSEFTTVNGSRTVKKYLASIADWTKVFAHFYENEYRLYIGSKQVLIFDTIASTWTLYEYAKNMMCGAIINHKLYYVGAPAAKLLTFESYIYEMDYAFDPVGSSFDGLNDDGIAIAYRLKGKFFDMGKAANRKKFKKLYLTFYSELISYDITLNINIDNENYIIVDQIVNAVSRWGDLAFGDKLTVLQTNLNYPIKIHHKGKKYNIQIDLQCEGLNEAFTLISSQLLVKVRDLK